MINKKAQGHTYTIIITTVLSLLVIFALLFFMKEKTSPATNLDACSNLGGNCRNSCTNNEINNKLFKCAEPHLMCCTSI